MANKNLNEVLGQDIKSVKELRAAIKEYQDALVGADAESQEYKDTTDKLAVAQEELKNVTKAGREGVIQYSDSIAGLEKQYREMYNAYRQMSEEMRNSDAGKQQAEELNALSEKLNNLKKDVGSYNDNIGRYSQSILEALSTLKGGATGLVGPFKTATQGITAFNTALKTNPVGAVIGLLMTLVTVVKQLVGTIKSNEESQMRLNQAMATFQPIIDASKNAMDKLGQAIVSVVEFIAKAVDKIRVAKAAFTDFLGITKGAKDAVKEQQKTYQELAKSINNLTKTKRDYQKANAEDKAEVERLREEASETTNLVEKKELLEEAKAKQAEIDNRNIEIAKQELAILEEQSKLTANDAEMNDKLAAAVAAVSNAEATAAANMRMFNKQLNGLSGSTSSAGSAMKNLREEAKKLYEETIENSKSEIQKLTEKYQKEKALLEKYHYDTKKLTAQYNKELAKIQTDAIKAAAEKSSKAFIEAARNRIGEGNDFSSISQILQDNLDSAFMDSSELKRKKEEYDKFLTNFFALDFDAVGAFTSNKIKEGEDRIKAAQNSMIDQAKDFVNEINEVLGLEIQFPPEITDESMQKFKQKLEYGQQLFEDAIKVMDSKVAKEMDLSAFNSHYQRILDNRIFDIQTFSEMAFNTDNVKLYNKLLEVSLDEQLDLEIDYYHQLLQIDELTTEERIQIMEQYYAALQEKRNRDIEREQKALDEKVAKLEYFEAVTGDFTASLTESSNGIINLANGYKTLYNAQIQEGKLNEKEVNAKKKRMENLEKVVLATTVAQIVASTAQGMVDTWTGYIKETSVVNPQTAAAAGFGAAGALATLNAASLAKAIGKSVGLATTAAGQIAAARGGYISNVNSLRDEGSGSVGVATPSEMETNPYSYSRTLQTVEEEEKLNRPIYVSVVDIIDMEEKVKVVENNTSF